MSTDRSKLGEKVIVQIITKEKKEEVNERNDNNIKEREE